MPFVRYSRDKRGYEQIWLVHAAVRRGRQARARVLYWYRSPPGVRVGREPFDAAVRKALEAQYPDVKFDWDQLAAAAVIPPLDAEPWRERRRAQREVRRGRAESAGRDALDEGPSEATAGRAAAESADGEPEAEPPGADLTAADTPETPAGDAAAGGPDPPQPADTRRRRRGGRHRRRRDASGAPGTRTTDGSREVLSEVPVAPDPTDRTTTPSDS